METNQKVPETVGELTMCVYSNLALLYAYELETFGTTRWDIPLTQFILWVEDPMHLFSIN